MRIKSRRTLQMCLIKFKCDEMRFVIDEIGQHFNITQGCRDNIRIMSTTGSGEIIENASICHHDTGAISNSLTGRI